MPDLDLPAGDAKPRVERLRPVRQVGDVVDVRCRRNGPSRAGAATPPRSRAAGRSRNPSRSYPCAAHDRAASPGNHVGSLPTVAADLAVVARGDRSACLRTSAGRRSSSRSRPASSSPRSASPGPARLAPARRAEDRHLQTEPVRLGRGVADAVEPLRRDEGGMRPCLRHRLTRTPLRGELGS